MQSSNGKDHDFCDDVNAEQPKVGDRPPNAAKFYEVTEDQLPMYCPTPESSLWNGHPRVYIPLEYKNQEARCPYCSAVFRLVD
jgi:uncharacterized Zn-finger protein